MSRPPSLQKSRDEYYSGDAAFEQLPADATDEQRKEHAHKWEVARETGDYSKLLKEGGPPPIKYVMQPIKSLTWRAFLDRTLLHADSDKRIGPVMTPAVLFCLSIVDVGRDGITVKRSKSKDFDGWEMADESVLDALDPRIVTELGNLVFDRQRDISGKV